MVAQNVSPTSPLSVDLFSMATRPSIGELSVHTMQPLGGAKPDALAENRSPAHCKYPSKKCWNLRVEKRNGELHKFCEYHRQKANSNQRRMEQRRKQMRMLQLGGEVSAVPGDLPHNKSFGVSSPCGVEHMSLEAFISKRDMCMDVPFTPSDMIDFEVGLDAAMDCMMLDNDIEMEPSDRPVDMYEADLFFLEHFMSEITRSGV